MHYTLINQSNMDDVYTQKSPSKKKLKKNKKRKEEEDNDLVSKKKKKEEKIEFDLNDSHVSNISKSDDDDNIPSTEESMSAEKTASTMEVKSNESGVLEWTKENDLHLLKSIFTFCKQKQASSKPKDIVYPKNIDMSVIQENFDHVPVDEIKKRWSYLLSKVRKLRTLEEVAEDIVKVVNDSLHEVKQSKKSVRLLKEEMGYPKKPLTAYILFCCEKRPQITEENPDLQQRDILKTLGAAWTSLPQEQQNKYKEMAEASMLKYKEELSLWEKEHPSEMLKSTPQKTPSKSSKSSMKHAQQGFPVNALEFYYIQQKESRKNEDLNIRIITEEWLNLSAKEESRWLEDFSQQLELKGFVDLASTIRSKLTQPKSKAAKDAWKSFEESVPLPPVAVYGMFQEKIADTIDENLTFQEKSKAIKSRWIAMKDSKKEKLVKKFNKRLHKFKDSLFNYLDTLSITIACEIVMMPQVMRILVRNES